MVGSFLTEFVLNQNETDPQDFQVEESSYMNDHFSRDLLRLTFWKMPETCCFPGDTIGYPLKTWWWF